MKYIFNYNNIQSLNIKINESESVIDNELRKKYDLIIRCTSIIKKVLKKDINNFKELENIKSDEISNFEFDRKISSSENIIYKVKNDFQSLENNKEFQEIYNSLQETNEILEASKSFYNKYTTEINLLIKKFPTNIISKMHRVKVRNYFDGKNMFDDEIRDFKL